MKKIFFIVLTTVFSVSVAFAETIYLKDGSLVRGTITNEDEKTLFVEMGDSWKQIDKRNIERIIKDDKSPQSNSKPDGLQQPPPVEQSAAPAVPPQQPVTKNLTKNIDIRLKFGNASGADNLEFTRVRKMTSDTDIYGSNVQVEVAVSPLQGSMAGPVFSAGVFRRQHSGKIIETTRTTTMDYDATGVSLAGGLRLKASENFNFEIKLELGVGQGEVALESPTYNWNTTKEDTYTSAAVIAGWYYAFSKPGFLLGLEIGAQSFTGEFEIWNPAGRWDSGKVTGSGVTANLALGFRF